MPMARDTVAQAGRPLGAAAIATWHATRQPQTTLQRMCGLAVHRRGAEAPRRGGLLLTANDSGAPAAAVTGNMRTTRVWNL